MRRTEQEKEIERARRLRELTERAVQRSQEARERAGQVLRRIPKKSKKDEDREEPKTRS